jgi:hypothetical protein
VCWPHCGSVINIGFSLQVLAPLANPYPFPIPQGAGVVTEDEQAAAAAPVVGPPEPGPEGPRPIGPHPEEAAQLANQGRRLHQALKVGIASDCPCLNDSHTSVQILPQKFDGHVSVSDDMINI